MITPQASFMASRMCEEKKKATEAEKKQE